ncbi:MAG: hypothetical protein KC588_14725, partial [Nitrospira sp.]|nr:hypothetical protein [Nitrospira sp.]
MNIGWLPGDGIGREVLEAAKIVLEAVQFDAAYVHGDIGWEFWKREGDALPERTIELLSTVDAALFGAITSKPLQAAEEELNTPLQGKGLVYRSPIVRMRQVFDLYICQRPCKTYHGNLLNMREGIDITVFRENTEDLYTGVEFYPVPEALSTVLASLSEPYRRLKNLSAESAISLKIT